MSRVAIFLNYDRFENFRGSSERRDRTRFLHEYRDDAAWSRGDDLLQRGHDVTLYVLSYGQGELRGAPGGLKVRFVSMPFWLRWADSLLDRLDRRRMDRMRREAVRFFGYRPALRQALADDEIELLCVQDAWGPRFTLMMRHLTVPLVGADEVEAGLHSLAEQKAGRPRWSPKPGPVEALGRSAAAVRQLAEL